MTKKPPLTERRYIVGSLGSDDWARVYVTWDGYRPPIVIQEDLTLDGARAKAKEWNLARRAKQIEVIQLPLVGIR